MFLASASQVRFLSATPFFAGDQSKGVGHEAKNQGPAKSLCRGGLIQEGRGARQAGQGFAQRRKDPAQAERGRVARQWTFNPYEAEFESPRSDQSTDASASLRQCFAVLIPE